MTGDGSQPRHWADDAADAAIATGRSVVVSSGISPSGEIHIGNMREVLTADAVFRALRERGVPARFNYVADNFDPLRRVYPFLDASVYAPLIGKPLSEIPCPCGRHESYADHFLAPFLESLRRLRVEVEVERADLLYKSGRMNGVVAQALEGRDRIAVILQELTGKQMDPDWSPYNPLCPQCGRITDARVTGWSAERQTVSFACTCAAAGEVPMAGGGKLTWRVDWPARWSVLGVTVEPFGKDHATRGGSYDTGVRISREVFGYEPPLPIPYEWISLKGKGDMSSSKGNVLSIADVLEVVPPEVLRYLVMRERPQRTITFDPGVPLLQLVDEVDDRTAAGADSRALELSRAGGFLPAGVPFKHLVVVAQVTRFDVDRTLAVLARTGYTGLRRDAIAERLGYAQRWLSRHAPEDIRFEVSETLPAAAGALTPDQRDFLARLASRLTDAMTGEEVHLLVYDLAQAFPHAKPAELFQAIYIALLGKPRGPRAGFFIAALGPSACAARFREASGQPASPSRTGGA
ncbi:MAG TPA: lysine--tRNA ligase [Candidatus Sulfotelmatobacter sp.]|jgi:lysyl-tRNA synthetase class 1|nr:lysine--tRNA ligase [Candidatus Sulfotelmatobacter sp.]